MSKKRFSTQYLYEDAELMDLAKSRNYCVKSQVATSFPINSNGRCVLVGIDVIEDFLVNEDYSFHMCATKGGKYTTEGYKSLTKKGLIKALVKEFEETLKDLLL